MWKTVQDTILKGGDNLAYIAPNSTIEFFADIGLDSNYENTLFFPDVQTKDDYFTALHKETYVENQSYTKAGKGVIKVQKPMSTMYKCGYMRFKNTSFENKWFYAFIDKVEYINNVTTEVQFTIDVIMTWMGVFSLKECFIERQHTKNDDIGANIADEGLDIGPYVVEYTSQTGRFTDYTICIFQSEPVDPSADVIYFSGLFSGLYLYIATNATSAIDHIKAMITANKGDSIIYIEMIPTHFVPDPVLGSDAPTLDRFVIQKPYTNFNYGDFNYEPHNNKLFTYPFKKLDIYNSEGETAEYKWELFNPLPDAESGATCAFTMRGCFGIQPEISMIPEGYKGQTLAYNEKITMGKFVSCAWASDAYQAYLAQMQSSLPASLLSQTLSTIAKTSIAPPIATAYETASILSKVTDLLALKAVHPSMPAHSHGTQSNDLMCALKAKDFYFYQTCITKNYAMMIDHYFDMFGYAIRQHAVPNMNRRTYYTYVKTIGCCVEGQLPSDDCKKIEDIFDKGVRFWKNHNNIGNYNLINAPLQGGD